MQQQPYQQYVNRNAIAFIGDISPAHYCLIEKNDNHVEIQPGFARLFWSTIFTK